MTLSRQYDEIMDKITLTDEMRARILKNTGYALRSAEKPRRSAKRYALLAACLAVVVLGALLVQRFADIRQEPSFKADQQELQSSMQASSADEAPLEQSQPMAAANGMAEVTDAAALAAAVGFPVSEATMLPFAAEQTTYVDYWGGMAEINYTGGGQTASLRKSIGTADNSGDYNAYSASATVLVEGMELILKGAAEDSYTLAIWTDGVYAYSMSVSQPQNADAWAQIVKGVQVCS